MTQDRLSLRKFERRDLAKEDCDRAMSLAHKLSMEVRAAEDRTQQMAREVEHWQERAARAEQWLRIIQQEIKEKLLAPKSSFDAEQKSLSESPRPVPDFAAQRPGTSHQSTR